MEDNVLDVDEIAEKGITVTTVVAAGLIETSIRQSGVNVATEGQNGPTTIAMIQKPVSAGDPRMQHDLVVFEVHAGKYGDFSEGAGEEVAP